MTRCATSRPRYALAPSTSRFARLSTYPHIPLLSLSQKWHIVEPSQIREERPQLQRRRLRLIHAGRLLPDKTQLTSWLGTLEERQQRAAATTTKGKEEADSSVLPAAAPAPWLHCSVGAQLTDGEEDGETQTQVRGTALQLLHVRHHPSDLTVLSVCA